MTRGSPSDQAPGFHHFFQRTFQGDPNGSHRQEGPPSRRGQPFEHRTCQAQPHRDDLRVLVELHQAAQSRAPLVVFWPGVQLIGQVLLHPLQFIWREITSIRNGQGGRFENVQRPQFPPGRDLRANYNRKQFLTALLRGAPASDLLRNAYSLTRIKEATGQISRKLSVPHPLYPSIFDPI